ncbi:MAG: inositol-3-phosphate synthase [Spirochaetota bacterium]|jgi:myo-inositol-1-phosphate synthase|nr:inositol-3-phosphate synthase [Spirochaetota bacterium]
MGRIKVGLVGIGNCASSLVQGTIYYGSRTEEVPGLITQNFAGYTPKDFEFTAAFDVDRRKVGKDLSAAIFEKPNCTQIFQPEIPHLGCEVKMGYRLDSIADHTTHYPLDRRFDALDDIYKSRDAAKKAIVGILRGAGVEVLVNYLPVGSEEAAFFYAECALEAHCAFVNAIPVFVSKKWGDKFREAGLPILGDDIKSQVGATIVHRVLTKLFEDRGQKIRRTYQLNVGGNQDFLNMLDRSRLESKKISKTKSVTSQMSVEPDPENIYVGPSDYVPWLNDNKLCFIRIEGEQYGGVPMHLELRLSVEDSPNSAGVITDAIRAAKVALDRKLSGPILEAACYLFKSPVQQVDDYTAKQMLMEMASGTSADSADNNGRKNLPEADILAKKGKF